MVLSNFSPYKIIKSSLEGLKPNEVNVITGRFGIDSERKTLSAIGKDLGLSRERIRQIEKDALRKLAVEIIEKNNLIIEQLIDSFKKQGGIIKHDKIADKFLEQAYAKNKNEFNSLNLIFYIIPQLKKIEKTRELEESWIMAEMNKDELIAIINDWVNHLQKSKKPETVDVLVREHPNHAKYELTFLSELPHVSKKVVKTESGHLGLATWPEVNPKNVRDKIYFVLKKEGKPLHFEEIAKKINEQSFSKRKIVKATVHNELIADDRFVLVGRGIYALSEWGYRPGTVKEVIIEILKKADRPLNSDEIIEEVLKKRTVKKNTVLINLQTKPEFKKVDIDLYTLK